MDRTLRSEIWTIVLLVGGIALLWAFRYLPMQDLPNHVAVSDYTVRLWRGEPEASQFYQLQLFRPTYRLYYLVAAPLSATFGALTGTRIMITLMWLGYVGACRALVSAAGLRPWVVLALAPWFFSLQFFTGLLPSLLASVFVLWSTWALLRLAQTGRLRWGILAGLLGTLAIATHVIMAVLWLAALFAWTVPAPGRRWLQAVLMAGVSLLPAVAWLPMRMAEHSVDLRALLASMRYLTPPQYVSSLLPTSALNEWSVSMGRAALLVAAVAFTGLLAWRGLKGSNLRQRARPAAGVAAICVAWWLAFLVMPNHTSRAGVWLINVRYVELAVFMTILLAAYGLQTTSARIERIAFAAVVLVVLLQGAGLHRTFAHVDGEYRAIEEICAAVPHGATLTTSGVIHGDFGTELPLAYHAHGYCSVGKAAYNAALFPDVHMPVRETPPAGYTRAPSAELGAYDFMLYDTVAPHAAPPSDGVLVAESGRWHLYRSTDSGEDPELDSRGEGGSEFGKEASNAPLDRRIQGVERHDATGRRDSGFSQPHLRHGAPPFG